MIPGIAETRMGEAPGVWSIESELWPNLSGVDIDHVLMSLRQTGTVLLRGFEPELSEFEAFSGLFCDRFHRSAARDEWRESNGDGSTARTPDVNFTLLAHTEGSYRPFPAPDIAFFHCQVPPVGGGGQTLLVDGRAFLDRRPDDARRRLESGGVIFEARWDRERWQGELGVDDVEGLDALAGDYPDFQYEIEQNEIIYRCRRQAIHEDMDGQQVFANAILAHLPGVEHARYRDARAYTRDSNRVYFADGEAIGAGFVNALIDIQDEVAHAHPLERNDLLLIDNSRVMHGRRLAQVDSPRVLLTRFGYLKKEFRASRATPGR
jgi:alpha-ketoglutarate-dependent taurine dioxygenase